MENSKKHLSSSQIRAYHNGMLSNHERFEIEKHTSNCQFCAEALDGQEILHAKGKAQINQKEVKRALTQKLNFSILNYSLIWTFLVLLLITLGFYTVIVIQKKNNQKSKELNEIKLIPKNIYSELKCIEKIQVIEQNNNNLGHAIENKIGFFENTCVKEIEDITKCDDSFETETQLFDENKLNYEAPFQKIEEQVSGKILDADQNPVPWATVRIQGKNIFSIADKNGDFTLQNIDNEDIIITSSIGKETVYTEVGTIGGSNAPIVLFDKITELEEVIVTGNANPFKYKAASEPNIGWSKFKSNIRDFLERLPYSNNQNPKRISLKIDLTETGFVNSISLLNDVPFEFENELLAKMKTITWTPEHYEGVNIPSKVFLSFKVKNNKN